MPKILAIDDREDNLITISAVLNNLIPECQVITAQSGPEGIEKTKLDSPDVILLDIKMPGMDGYSVCKKLKEDEDTKQIPVVMISAIKKETEDLVKGLDAGADAYLTKPINELVLAAQIKTSLRLKTAEDDLRKQRGLLEKMVQERTAELAKTNRQLSREINERKQAEAALSAKTRDLSKRVKELKCLYAVSTLCENPDITTDALLQGIAGYLPPAWQYPESTGARIVLDGRIFTTGKFKETKWQQRSDIYVNGRQTGAIEVCFLDERPEIDEGPFMKEERELLNLIASRVGNVLERKQVEENAKRLETQLQQAQKMEAIGTLAGGIAHDFNNILFPIVGFSEMIREELPVASSLRDYANEIFLAAIRAKDLVDQILTFSRQGVKEAKPLKLQPIVKEALKLLRATIPTTIDIQKDLDPACGVVVADITQIHQIVMNLATNAYHAMEETGGVLKVSLKQIRLKPGHTAFQDLPPGEYVCLTVADTGIGIEKSVLEKIFDPYFTTKAKGRGTGLGLSVVRGIVKSCQGDIRVYSQPGKGTEICVCLPIMERNQEDIQTTISIPIKGGTEKILLVDDEEAVAKMEQEMLAYLGYHVTICTSSLEASKAFKTNPDSFDLVVTDMTMPNMTGDQLAMELIKTRPDIPIIICTGFSERINQEKAAAMGMKGLLMKPLVRAEMAQMVRKALDEAKSGRQDQVLQG